MAKMLDAPKDLGKQVMFEASARNGCRTGEVCTIQLEDFDFTDQVFWILDSKKHKYRATPLNPVFALHVEEYIRINHLTSGWLLQKSKHSGRPGKLPFLQPQTVHKAWERQCVSLGLPMMTPRIARAYSAWMLSYGYKEHASMRDVQYFLGHDNSLSTEHYMRMIDDFDTRKERYQRIIQSGEITTQNMNPLLEVR